MTGTAIHPAQVTGTVDIDTAQTSSPSLANTFSVSAVIDRLSVHLSGGSNNDDDELFNICVALARGIDDAVGNNDIPGRAPDLPYMLKQVCQRGTDDLLLSAIMVMMISVKSACRNGWFSQKDSEELHILSNEIASFFGTVIDMNYEESTFRRDISAIMSRFYPRLKMGEVLAIAEAKPGFGAVVKDFHISKNAISSPDDKIYLFVAQTDNMETASCLINPQEVNFLLNGQPVDGRTSVYQDPGPQMPTLVTHLLKDGTNLLQAVGQFNGNYIIVVAFMSMVQNPTGPALPDYVPPAAAPDSDNEIIEGPSRISLNCPISFSCIKTPVKGHLCKHLQCFDFDNFVGINSRRPSWRCPHCSQSVCFDDIRIDQGMVKVLKEVGANVSYVKIYADGSWETVTETDDHLDKPPLHQDSDADILDLTEGDNDNYATASNSRQDNDTKPSPQFQGQLPVPSFMKMKYVYRNVAPHTEDVFWGHQATGMANINAISQGQSQLLAYGRYPMPARHVMINPMVSVDRQQQFSRFQLNPHQFSHMMGVQNWGHHDSSHISSQSVQQFGPSAASPHQTIGFRYTPAPPTPYQTLHHRIPYPPPSPEVSQPGLGGSQQTHYSMSAAERAVQISGWSPSTPSPIHTSVREQRGPRVLDVEADENWRPSGRMRGSLSGRAYSDALKQMIIEPTQPVQASRPPVLNTPRPVLPPNLQALMANRSGSGGSLPDVTWEGN